MELMPKNPFECVLRKYVPLNPKSVCCKNPWLPSFSHSKTAILMSSQSQSQRSKLRSSVSELSLAASRSFSCNSSWIFIEPWRLSNGKGGILERCQHWTPSWTCYGKKNGEFSRLWISIGGTLAKICEFYGELIGTGTCGYLCGLISGKPSNLCQRFDANPTRHISYHLAIEHSHGKSQCLDHIRGGRWCLI